MGSGPIFSPPQPPAPETKKMAESAKKMAESAKKIAETSKKIEFCISEDGGGGREDSASFWTLSSNRSHFKRPQKLLKRWTPSRGGDARLGEKMDALPGGRCKPRRKDGRPPGEEMQAPRSYPPCPNPPLGSSPTMYTQTTTAPPDVPPPSLLARSREPTQ